MTKNEWWATLTPLEKVLVRDLPGLCKELFSEFGPFNISTDTYEGYTVQDYQPHRVEK